MKKPVVKQIEEVTAEFQPEVLVPKEQANLMFSCNTEFRAACQQFGEVRVCPVSPENCYVRGKGVEVVTVGEEATAILHAMATADQECDKPVENISCELLSTRDKITVKCSVRKVDRSKYEIRYTPTTRGRHQLHVKVEGEHVKGSPFAVVVKVPIEKLGTPVRIIDGIQHPWGVSVNERGEIVVAENEGHCISIFSPEGEKVRTFGSQGSGPGQFNRPEGVAIDPHGSIVVADFANNCIQKFSSDGKFIKSVGTNGGGPLQFSGPVGIAISQGGRIYVCDSYNHRVQVLNPDLTFHNSFGSRGREDGQFIYPYDAAFDSKGNAYIADYFNNRIQVFTGDGRYLRKFGKPGSGNGELNQPVGITIDSDDMVFVCECGKHRVSVFTSQGQFVRTIRAKGAGPGQFSCPYGITVDKDGLLYVSDTYNQRLQIF